MKLTTINFWAGVLVGFGITKINRILVKDFKDDFNKSFNKSFRAALSQTNERELTKECLYEINDINAGRITNSFGTSIDKICLSELLNAEKYKTDQISTPDNVVNFDKHSKYITIQDNTDNEKNPEEDIEDSESENTE